MASNETHDLEGQLEPAGAQSGAAGASGAPAAPSGDRQGRAEPPTSMALGHILSDNEVLPPRCPSPTTNINASSISDSGLASKDHSHSPTITSHHPGPENTTVRPSSLPVAQDGESIVLTTAGLTGGSHPPSPASIVTFQTTGASSIMSFGTSEQASSTTNLSYHTDFTAPHPYEIDDQRPGEDDNQDFDEPDAEAAEQAEAGIVVDDDIESNDAGYESGDGSNASTSIASSITDYPFENGRRYHKFREGRYHFPNDDVEQEREDMKHVSIKLLCQQLHFAPIGESPQQILDIGTGTGIWAIEMGDKFPSASVLGIDLSPIQPEWVPPNVKFMVDDAESPWLHPRNCFDYIHTRHTIMAIKDWPRLLRRAHEHIRPGGWFEMQEVYHFPISSNNSMPPTHPVAEYWAKIGEGLENLGVDFFGVKKMAGMMRDAGFINVTERVLQIPIGPWPKNKSLKTVGLYWRTILMDGIQAIALGPLTRGCRWSPEEVELFLIQVRKAYYDNSCLMCMPLHIIYGQKSELVS